VIEFEKFSFSYNSLPRLALADISLRIDDGEFVLITGASGSGKSTFARCFNGLVPHFYGGRVSGSARVQGLDILQKTTREMATRVGMVFQDPENQIVSTTVEREIAFGLENLGYPAALMARRVEEALDTLGIAGLRRSRIKDLSGGQKQKVAIASVLALHPEVLVLDEPTSELDPQSAEDVLSVVKRLNEDLGLTVVLVEHRLDRALPFCDRLLVFEQGKIAIDGPPGSILSESFISLRQTGVGIPPVVRLFREATDGVFSDSPLPLTVKEGRRLFRTHLQGLRPGPFVKVKQPCGEPVIKVEKLDFVYPGGTQALRNIDLTVCRGEFVAIAGRNASGKSTLIKHFAGLLKPTRGRLTVLGFEASKKTLPRLAGKIGMVLQNPNDHLLADSVEEEIAFALKNLGFSAGDTAERIERVLTQFDLEGYRREYPQSLSGGEKQRVALASVVAAGPEILVLDEPTRGMDQRLKNKLMVFLSDYAGRGKTVILVSHDIETVAEYAQRVILMSEGEIIVDGDKHSVLSRALLFSPQINRLVQPFREQGLDPEILTVEELRQVLGC
jgi:energy-coupling factor transport system ATP-binding protein